MILNVFERFLDVTGIIYVYSYVYIQADNI
ncbi:MAG: hypothetical protein RL711_2053, partial [Bacteroidota bacterium]